MILLRPLVHFIDDTLTLSSNDREVAIHKIMDRIVLGIYRMPKQEHPAHSVLPP